MNDIDLKISQSEAEWRRYRQETIGVRESGKAFLAALGRSMQKRLRGVRGNLHPLSKRITFEPSYAGNRKNIVVSLTSTQKRIAGICPTLESLAAQSRKPDLIVLWLGKGGSYPRKTIEKIRAMGIRIRFREDLGPHTKYCYAFREFGNDLIITADDDILYHERMIEELLQAHAKHKDCVIARRVHKIRFGRDRKILKYADWIREYRDAKAPAHDLLATGVGGVLYPPEVIALLRRDDQDFLGICPKADDIWLKFLALSKDVKICAAGASGFVLDVINSRSQKYSLASENVDKGKNDEQIKACADYFGMSDDLCERVLS
ncbi:MAG: glycosyltransferase [Lachnospiraceae bacterium]|nr:glycosyltransferase [Lachnospiraceae bacterium]